MNSSIAIDKRQMRGAFDRAAPRYDGAARLQRDIAGQLIERLDVIRLQPRRILDIGCGTGYLSSIVAGRYRGAHVIGIDLAEAMAHHAATARNALAQRLRAVAGLRARCDFLCSDAEALPLASESVDMVVSNLTLQWCDVRAVFAEVVRVLKPGGLFMFSTFGPDTLKELRAAWHSVDGDVHVHPFVDMHDIGDWMLADGFADPVLDVERVRLGYRDVMGLLKELKQLGAHNVATSRRRALTGRERFERFRAAYPVDRPDGSVVATYEVVFGHAWAPHPAQLTPSRNATAVPLSELGKRRGS